MPRKPNRFDDDYNRNADGYHVVEVAFTEATMTHLERLAEMGIFGIGIPGVVEGLVYRGLQELADDPIVQLPCPRDRA